MRRTAYFLALFAALLVSDVRCGTPCQNFLVQYCTDIPLQFEPIAAIRCIQLVPVQFYKLVEYSVQNYVVKKATTCYDVVLYNSSSPPLFSNTCQERCPAEYCRLFDNQPNNTVINIFYSPTFTYELRNSTVNDPFSYDYYPFVVCSNDIDTYRVVVYALAAFIGCLTAAVVLLCVIRHCCKGRPRCNPWDWRWYRDLLLCRFYGPSNSVVSPEPEPHRLYFIGNDTPRSNGHNRSPARHPPATNSSTPVVPVSSSVNYLRKTPNIHQKSSTGNSTYPPSSNSTSVRTAYTIEHSGSELYPRVHQQPENNGPVDRTTTQQPGLVATLSRLSSKASNALSGTLSSRSRAYGSLRSNSSYEYPIVRL